MDNYKIAAIAGSLRKGSYNRMLLNAAIELAPGNMDFEVLKIDDFPLFNHDELDKKIPDTVAEFKSKIMLSDALLVATPEYNHSIPGVLKNAIDWASRPLDTYPFTGKPLGIMGASTGLAGSLRAQLHLRQILFVSDDMRSPELFVQLVHDKFDSAGRLIDEKLKGHLVKFMESFEKWIKKSKLIQ
jgi:chromate reductase